MTDMNIQVMGSVRGLGRNNGKGFGFDVIKQTYRRDKRGNYSGMVSGQKIKVTGELAEWCKNSLEDGALVSVEGRFRTEATEYEGGVTQYRSHVIAEGIKRIDGRCRAN